MSRLADRMEAVQLGLGERLLGRARDALEEQRPKAGELRLLTGQLADALADALLIAESRGARLRGTGESAGQPSDSRWSEVHDWTVCPSDTPSEWRFHRDKLSNPCPLGDSPTAPWEAEREWVGGTAPALRAYGLLTLPGGDLASARIARHYVRDTCRSWGLPAATTDDLVAITGELVANALEHTDSRTVAITCALTADTVTVGVTDDGRSGDTPEISASAGGSGSECEGGRGLLITDALATRWGTRRTGGGLTVWAEVVISAVADTSADSG
ncbi:ATP-binding protein [Streptomyces sp. AC512_CC834]|uniref:ATP-binding protein n=1 Tax=Streptomyces sp. AC512_CC834 TaxID=2823691 RepID=UPI001C26E861|nr:ATP-binding protein [Streptomyces sp. AC512_CC834]